MAILIDRDTKVIVQGISGRIGKFHATEMIAYGTNVVGGVTPGKGGERMLDVPVFDTVRQAVRETGAEASLADRAAALRGGRDHGGGGRRHPHRGLRHRRHPGPGHDAGQAVPAPLPGRDARCG